MWDVENIYITLVKKYTNVFADSDLVRLVVWGELTITQ
jgi:hypothetical protein